jgi:hypothetical protein
LLVSFKLISKDIRSPKKKEIPTFETVCSTP